MNGVGFLRSNLTTKTNNCKQAVVMRRSRKDEDIVWELQRHCVSGYSVPPRGCLYAGSRGFDMLLLGISMRRLTP